jgi:hypothetical protein
VVAFTLRQCIGSVLCSARIRLERGGGAVAVAVVVYMFVEGFSCVVLCVNYMCVIRSAVAVAGSILEQLCDRLHYGPMHTALQRALYCRCTGANVRVPQEQAVTSCTGALLRLSL